MADQDETGFNDEGYAEATSELFDAIEAMREAGASDEDVRREVEAKLR